MCGGNGLYHLVGALAVAPAVQPTNVIHDVKLMYAQGVIDTETFHRLITMAQGGHLTREDLHHIGQRTQQRTPRPVMAGPAGHEDHGAHPDNTRLSELETQLARLQAQAEDAQQDAQRAHLTDEQIRAYLEIRQGALFRAEVTQREIEALRNGK